MNNNSSELINEIVEHLRLKRFKLALITSKKAVETFPENPEAHSLYASALLENLNPFLSLDMINYAVELSSNSPVIRLNRAYILYRLSIYDGALIDNDFFLSSERDNTDALLLKVKILSGSERFFEALELLEEIKSCQKIDESFDLLFTILKTSLDISSGTFSLIHDESEIIKLCKKANDSGYYWFSIFVHKYLLDKIRDENIQKELKLIYFISLVALFRVKEAEVISTELNDYFYNHPDFNNAVTKLRTINKFRTSSEHESDSVRNIISQTELIKVKNSQFEVLSARFFDLTDSISSGKRKYLIQFDENNLTYVAVELLLRNPYFKKKNYLATGIAIWYLNDSETGRNNFEIELKYDWQIIEFVQSWGTEIPGFWKSGEGRVEIYLENQLICTRKFLIGETEVMNLEIIEDEILQAGLLKSETAQPPSVDLYRIHNVDSVSLENLLNEFYEFIGLENLKQSIVDFLTYLNFVNERKRKGVKSDEKLELHCLFLGNPGTGKTSVARLLGKILKSMGILENGHVIEVDRSGLIGQYIGETAIKTDKVISEALGGILFIDEAYTLKKPDISSDFGQEAIDILLKRMEDYKGRFIVIAAGYSSLMNEFINSNPGLKSRFTHTFTFDDYSPSQLVEIFKLFATKEEYTIDKAGEELLLKHLEVIYKHRDQSFGNARLIRKIFSEAKIQLSKRYQACSEEERIKFSLNKISSEDIRSAFEKIGEVVSTKISDIKIVDNLLERINNLTGLDNFKREANELAKLARYYFEEGENISEKFYFHFFFTGKNYAGQSVAAKYLTELLATFRIIPKNEFYEIDIRQFIGEDIYQTTDRTNKIFNRIRNGVILIKDFDSIFNDRQLNSSVLSEFISQFITRLQKDADRIRVIAETDYQFPDNLSDELISLKTFFSKIIIFNDYTPDELLEIFLQRMKEKKLDLSDESKELLRKFFYHVYRNRDKYPPNNLLLQNISDIIQKKHLLRIADIPRSQRTDEMNRRIDIDEIKDIISLEKSKEFSTSGDYQSSVRKYLDKLDKLAGLKEVKNTILRIINSEKVAAIRKERGLELLPRNLHGLFIGNPGTGKSTIAKIYGGILFELNLISSNEPIEIDRLTVNTYLQNYNDLTSEILLKFFDGKLVVLNYAGQFLISQEFSIKKFFDTTLALLKKSGNRFVLILSDTKNEIEKILSNYPDSKTYFTNTFLFSNYTPREMLEIALNFTQQYGYQLDEGAWQLLLDIFNELYSGNQEKGNINTVLDLILNAITNQEARLGKKENITNEDLTTITIEDIAKLF